jgi:hypothetical protein
MRSGPGITFWAALIYFHYLAASRATRAVRDRSFNIAIRSFAHVCLGGK